ncbi:TetR family transcriptional regulator [Mesorhizobium sp. L-8-10]|uniref:TetR/AcrR family transcriptional regulator n=1 Tax=unclassified Mesorhizobium TaxID=325217 RepID=UPI00192649D6|nr:MULTISPECIES: TetR/AcrR family transcriptional regulator [unclassified Mesorhizobium]BCH21848.1 TetR family transcriptional regulator [Mesorhizobium sp. L-8-3]BCH29535.1 TetR family transcriptional regulator [Mesorhizobium sp. L-8-10]
MTPEAEFTADPKRARIIEGAMRMFLAYGFARTTMDDIARAAEVSRPALYLLFKNKSDIYRAIATMLFDQSIATAQAELAVEAPFGERVVAAIDKSLIGMMQPFAQSPHGAEILDMKNSLAGELMGAWRERLVGLLAEATAAEAARTGTDLAARGLSAQTLAELLLDGLEGMKMRTSDPDEQRQAARGLVTVIELALRA